MTSRHQTKLVREGQFIAEVEVELIEENEGWAPYLSLEDARRLDSVREACEAVTSRRRARQARVFRSMPVAV
jgi:hypothetical protein